MSLTNFTNLIFLVRDIILNVISCFENNPRNGANFTYIHSATFSLLSGNLLASLTCTDVYVIHASRVSCPHKYLYHSKQATLLQ